MPRCHIVGGGEGVMRPQRGDSIFINPVSAVEDSLCWQNNPDNRRVQLRWEPGSVVTIVSIVPSTANPMDASGIGDKFGISDNSGKIIAVEAKLPFDTLMRDGEPVIDEKDGRPAFGTAMVYDAVGNVVKADLLIKKAAINRVYHACFLGRDQQEPSPGGRGRLPDQRQICDREKSGYKDQQIYCKMVLNPLTGLFLFYS